MQKFNFQPQILLEENIYGSNPDILADSIKKVANVIDIITNEKNCVTDNWNLFGNNIISIEGERGSGKTSIILSICNLIINKSSHHNFFSDTYVLGADYKTKNNWNDMIINANKFGNVVNITDIIVSKMYIETKKIINENQNYLNGSNTLLDELLKLFANIAEGLNYNPDDYKNYINSIDLYDYSISYYSLTDRLNQAIEIFLKLMSEYMNNNYKQMIIFIDDIDLSTKNCFKMIEEIRNNFNFNNIIFVFAYKYDSLKCVLLNEVNKEFLISNNIINQYKSSLKNNNGIKKEQIDENNYYKIINDRVDKYIEKVFPNPYVIRISTDNEIIEKYYLIFSEKILKINSRKSYLKRIFERVFGDHINLRTINQKFYSLFYNDSSIETINLEIAKMLNVAPKATNEIMLYENINVSRKPKFLSEEVNNQYVYNLIIALENDLKLSEITLLNDDSDIRLSNDINLSELFKYFDYKLEYYIDFLDNINNKYTRKNRNWEKELSKDMNDYFSEVSKKIYKNNQVNFSKNIYEKSIYDVIFKNIIKNINYNYLKKNPSSFEEILDYYKKSNYSKNKNINTEINKLNYIIYDKDSTLIEIKDILNSIKEEMNNDF